MKPKKYSQSSEGAALERQICSIGKSLCNSSYPPCLKSSILAINSSPASVSLFPQINAIILAK
ncbi:MAG TPA: hypothetical protein VK074_02915 [Fodinibius sp.]|nr:hypothetical protein [Fodinibius sp.]